MSLYRSLLWCTSLLVLLFLLVPVLVVIPVSFNPTPVLDFPPETLSGRWYEEFLTSSGWISALRRSVLVGLIAAGVATPVGLLAAMGLVRGHFPGKRLLRTAIMLPLTVPVIVLSIGIYNIYSELRLIGSVFGLGLAHAMLGLPFVVLVMSGAVQNFDERLEQAAWSLGSSKLHTFFTITLPNLRPALLASALFAFVMSFDEIVISIFISGTAGETLPVRIFSFMRTDITPVIAAASVVLMLALCALVVSARLLGKLAGRYGES